MGRGEGVSGFDAGDRVMTPRGPGVIVYRTMKAPSYSEPKAYSVKLDGVVHTGVMYSAAKVQRRIDEAPRRSPEPCSDECPGWDVFYVGHCAAPGHAEDCAADGKECRKLEVQCCDECWSGHPDAPGDAYYQEHAACQDELAKQLSYLDVDPIEPEECENDACAGCTWCDANGVTKEVQS